MPEQQAIRRRITPSVPFTFHVEDADGSTFDQSVRIAYDLNAFAVFEEVTGINLMRDLGDLFTAPSVSVITALLWAGLQVNHADVFGGRKGLDLVRANITLTQLKVALEACIEAFLSQLPKEKADAIRNGTAGETPDPLATGQAQQ